MKSGKGWTCANMWSFNNKAVLS